MNHNLFHEPPTRTVLRSLWAILMAVLYVAMIACAISNYIEHDYQRATLDIVLALLIRSRN